MILEPCYDFPRPNESILLMKAKASFCVQGKTYDGDAEVRLDLLPKAGIRMHVALPSGPYYFDLSKVQSLAFDGNEIPGFILKYNPSSNGDASLRWCPKHEPVIGRGNQNTQIDSVVFHLFNYKHVISNRRSIERVGTSAFGINHTDLKALGWSVELKSLRTTTDIFKDLEEEGGYGLTHVGCVRREDGTCFDGKTAGNMLDMLQFFFSFSKGVWCNPCVAVGFDDKENKVWESWTSPQGGWDEPSSWFDPHHCEQLINLFPGFVAKWENESWQKALREVIYWYLNSNASSQGIDAGIILTQAAIERLSFEYAVRHKRLIEAEGFKTLRASDKFRLLFSSLEIPIDIPAAVPDLLKYAKQNHWLDAPQAITEIRNSLVHPEHKQRGKFNDSIFWTWNLGQWYLELAILRICEYSGTYSNRVASDRWLGKVEPVPWHKDSTNVTAPTPP